MTIRADYRFVAVAVIGTVFAVRATVCLGQANFIEDFEGVGTVAGGAHGPSGLIAEGWTFRNQSDPEGSGDWDRSAWAHQGSWSLSVDWSVGSWDGPQAEESSWAILPAIAGQVATDVVRFFYFNTQASPLVPAGRLEVRYSPSGGTNTGSGSGDVGDFAVLLSEIPAVDDQWTEHSVALPGSGRIALRFHVPPVASQQEFWAYFEIDNLSVGPDGPPCNLPPAPSPGENVTWAAADSPFEVCENLTIPAGGTVTIEPGVVIDVQDAAILTIAGTVVGLGTSVQPITFTGSSRVEVSGTLELEQAVVECLVQPDQGGSLLFTDTTFQGGGALTTVTAPTYIWSGPAFLKLDGCSFDHTYLRVDTCTVLLQDTAVLGDFCEVGGAYLYADNLSIDGAPFGGLYLHSYVQPLYLDNLSVTNSAGAGLDLVAGNFLLGGNVTLQGNQYPVQIGGAGILPGSVLPTTGNVNNYIKVADAFEAAVGGMAWADAGIPYVLQDTYTGGRMRILPGATVRLGANATFWGEPGFVDARGLPGSPVVFERFDPSQSWQGLQYFHRFENCVIDGGQIGARFHSSSVVGFIDDSIIRNCDFGTQNDVIVRKTRFLNNTTGSWSDNWPGALDGDTGANSFDGNTLAADSAGHLIDARSNWWGDPSGPNSPDNPGGTGETVLGAGVTTVPFLTAEPDFADHPPVVNLNPNSFLLEPGAKVIVSWDSQDDNGVISHRIEFDHPLDGVSTVAELPGSQKAYEWTVPDIGFAVNNKSPVLRVTAIDAASQEGWDEQAFLIPTGDVQGTLTITSDLSGPFLAGSEIGQLCWTAQDTNPLGYSVAAALYLDGDRSGIGLGGVTSYLSCLSGQVQVPFASTDTARIALVIQESLNNVKYFFSDYFTVRPDARIGDAPPSVSMLTPGPGDSYSGGSVVPVSWTASDDQGLRSFDVQASYDGGSTWHFIATDLSGAATTFDWQLPPSSGIPDVRVRVMARDLRFQTSSDGASRVFEITAGNAAVRGDLDGDGDVDLDDYAVFSGCWMGPQKTMPLGCDEADLDADGDTDFADFAALQQVIVGP